MTSLLAPEIKLRPPSNTLDYTLWLMNLTKVLPVFLCLHPNTTHQSSLSPIKSLRGLREHAFFPAFTILRVTTENFPEPNPSVTPPFLLFPVSLLRPFLPHGRMDHSSKSLDNVLSNEFDIYTLTIVPRVNVFNQWKWTCNKGAADQKCERFGPCILVGNLHRRKYNVLLSRAKLVPGELHVLEAFICLDTLYLNDCVISRLMLRQRAIFALSPAEQGAGGLVSLYYLK